MFREEVLVFSSVHVSVLTVCKHTMKISSVSPGCFSDAGLEEITSESQSHLHSGTFLGQSGYGYSMLLVLLLSSSGEMLKRLISVLLEGCFILTVPEHKKPKRK